MKFRKANPKHIFRHRQNPGPLQSPWILPEFPPSFLDVAPNLPAVFLGLTLPSSEPTDLPRPSIDSPGRFPWRRFTICPWLKLHLHNIIDAPGGHESQRLSQVLVRELPYPAKIAIIGLILSQDYYETVDLRLFPNGARVVEPIVLAESIFDSLFEGRVGNSSRHGDAHGGFGTIRACDEVLDVKMDGVRVFVARFQNWTVKAGGTRGLIGWSSR